MGWQLKTENDKIAGRDFDKKERIQTLFWNPSLFKMGDLINLDGEERRIEKLYSLRICN